MSEKSAKEIAFIREHFVVANYTDKFTRIVDKHLELPTKGKFLYAEVGTATHALELREVIDENVAMFATETHEEAVKIARTKIAALKADVDLITTEPFDLEMNDETFEYVLGDATLIQPKRLTQFVTEIVRVSKENATTAFFMPTAGSFGDFFSLLWELLFRNDLTEYGAQAEKLISDLPTVSEVKSKCVELGLKNVQTWTRNTFLEFATGEDFAQSPIVADFLMPIWLKEFPPEVKEIVSNNIAATIDEERHDLSFRLTLKATFVIGQKEELFTA